MSDKPKSSKKDKAPEKAPEPAKPERVSVVVAAAHDSWVRGERLNLERTKEIDARIKNGLLVVES